MKDTFRMKLLAVLLCAALVLGLGAVNSAAEEEIWFTAVGDKLLPLSAGTMPFQRNGDYYLPYSVFSDGSMGIRCSRDVSNYTLTFSSDFASITFDSVVTSSADVASSISNNVGSLARAVAISRRCR